MEQVATNLSISKQDDIYNIKYILNGAPVFCYPSAGGSGLILSKSYEKTGFAGHFQGLNLTIWENSGVGSFQQALISNGL